MLLASWMAERDDLSGIRHVCLILFFAISPSSAPLGVVLAQKTKGAFDGQRGIDHPEWEIAISPSSAPLGVVLAQKTKGAFDGQRGIDHPGWEIAIRV